MSSDVLARVCAEIDARLQELRPALAEYERLLEAEHALASDGSAAGVAARAEEVVRVVKAVPVAKAAARATKADSAKAVSVVSSRVAKQDDKPEEQPLAPAGAPAPKRSARTSAASPGRRGRRGSAAGAIKRAASDQRDASQHAIVAALEHGSHTLSELVLVTAIAAAELRKGVRHLQQAGTITRTKRDGRAAYALASSSTG